MPATFKSKVTAEYDPNMDDKKDLIIVKVRNCFSIKDELKTRDYK